MIDGIPRISVLIITYNQEDVISRAIDSLLTQRDYIFEICVSDDCSKDKTWEILQDYSIQYPGLFVLNRNNPNLGIFENVEKTWTMPSGDMIYQLAGDDECGAGWFKKVVEFIKENHIDYKKESICIYSDYITYYPNGESRIFKNDLVKVSKNVFKLALRGLVRDRGCCYSRNVLNKFIKVSCGKSHRVEIAQDRQRQLFSDYNFYIPFVGNVYYASIGVSALRDEEQKQDRLLIGPFSKQFFSNYASVVSNNDINYLSYFESKLRYSYYPTFFNLLRIIPSFVSSLNIKILLIRLRGRTAKRGIIKKK